MTSSNLRILNRQLDYLKKKLVRDKYNPQAQKSVPFWEQDINALQAAIYELTTPLIHQLFKKAILLEQSETLVEIMKSKRFFDDMLAVIGIYDDSSMRVLFNSLTENQMMELVSDELERRDQATIERSKQ